MTNNIDFDWKIPALEAFDIAFTASGNKKEISQNQLENAIHLFYQSIISGADEYWPYIKLADLVVNEKEKLKLYAQAWKVQPNPYSESALFKQIIADHPSILDTFIL